MSHVKNQDMRFVSTLLVLIVFSQQRQDGPHFIRLENLIFFKKM